MIQAGSSAVDPQAAVIRIAALQKIVVLIVLAAIALSGCATQATPTLSPDDTPSPAPGIPPSLTPGNTPTPSAIIATPTESVPPPKVGDTQRWIEVDIAAQMVRLREGDKILDEYPAATGVAISVESTTYPGVYQVQQMIKGPIENVPDVFVADILIYDLAAGVGIHSIPMDKDGKFYDSTLGTPASGGCVRVGESDAVYEFARLGMKVWVH